MTAIDARAARSSVRRRVTGPDQPATSAATVAATLTAPSGSISRPMRWEYDANQTWKSVGERLFQKATNETPMTSIPPESRPSAKQASIINAVAIAVSSAAHQPKREPGTHPLEDLPGKVRGGAEGVLDRGPGTVNAMTSAEATASPTPAWRAFVPARANSSLSFASAGSRTPKKTSCPRLAQAAPSVPPTSPAPMIAILIRLAHRVRARETLAGVPTIVGWPPAG